MAKYFSTPSRSFHGQLAEDQSCHLRDEKSCMERLLTEKNAVIESLQEQVSNAKEKLVELMSAECPYDSPEWADPAAASAHGLPLPGPSECPAASGNESRAAGVDSLHASEASQHTQGSVALASRRDTSPSPDQKDSMPFKQFCDHLGMGCSQKPKAEQSEGPERGDQEPMAPSQSLMADRMACEPHKPRQNSEALPERLPRVSSVVREKLQEVLHELDLGSESSLSPLPGPQQLWKSTSSRNPQKLSPSKLGFSPYVVRRRRATQRARSHIPGSVGLNMGHQANSAVSSAQSGLIVQNRGSPRLDHHNARSKVQKSSSVKPSPLLEPHRKQGTPEGSKQCETEPGEAGGCDVAFPCQPSASALVQSPAAPCLPSSPALPKQRQPRPRLAPGCPSVSSGCYNLDSESSSSDEFFCHCHRPYCEICFQSSLDSNDSDTSDSDLEQVSGLVSWEKLWARSKPVVNFKDDLKPTLV